MSGKAIVGVSRADLAKAFGFADGPGLVFSQHVGFCEDRLCVTDHSVPLKEWEVRPHSLLPSRNVAANLGLPDETDILAVSEYALFHRGVDFALRVSHPLLFSTLLTGLPTFFGVSKFCDRIKELEADTVSEENLADVSATNSEYATFAKLSQVNIKALDVTAERLDVKVGTLKVDLDFRGFGSVVLDGKPVTCRALSIDTKAGELPTIRLEIIADDLGDNKR